MSKYVINSQYKLIEKISKKPFYKVLLQIINSTSAVFST